MSNEQIADKLALMEMGSRYCAACDRKDWDMALELFTEDAEVDAVAVYGKSFSGHADIRTFFESAPDCLGHHATGFYSDIDGASKATACFKMLTMFKRNTFTVDYDWDLVKVDGIWKISRQSFRIFGKQDLATS